MSPKQSLPLEQLILPIFYGFFLFFCVKAQRTSEDQRLAGISMQAWRWLWFTRPSNDYHKGTFFAL